MTENDGTARQRVIEIMRAAGTDGRIALMQHMTDDMLFNVRRCIVNLFPNESLGEWKLRFVQAMYGKDLSDRLRCRINSLSADDPSTISWNTLDPGFMTAWREINAHRSVGRQSGLT